MAEDPPVDVLAVGGRFRCALDELERWRSRLSRGAHENSIARAPVEKAFGQVEQVGHHDDPNAGTSEREEDLAADVGAFAFVRRGEGLVAQQ